jgi:hypothetical protein
MPAIGARRPFPARTTTRPAFAVGAYTVAIRSASVAAHSITVSNRRAGLKVDTPAGGGSAVTVAGALSNAGHLSIGRVDLAAATAVTVAKLVNSGTVDLIGGTAPASLTVKGNVVNSSQFNLDLVAGGGGAVLTIGGTLINGNELNIGHTHLTRATTVTTARLVNKGEINLFGGTPRATISVAAAAPATLTGSCFIAGNALLRYASGAIRAIGAGASLSLIGAKARVALAGKTGSSSALAKLAGNAGSLVLADGASVKTTGAFDNTGKVDVDGFLGGLLTKGGDVPLRGGSSLRIGGTLTNSGRLLIGSTSVGSSNIEAATVVAASSLRNTSSGEVAVVSGPGVQTATLSLSGASSDAGSIEILHGGILALGSVMTVTGSLIIGGGTITGGTLSGPGTIGSAAFLFADALGVGKTFESTLDRVTIAAGATFSAETDLVVRDVVVDGALIGRSDAGLLFGLPGIDSMSHVSGFATITLANGGANTLTLTNASFAGLSATRRITVIDGDSGNAVDGSGLTGSNAIVVRAGGGADFVTGGDGSDRFFAGGNTIMTGGAGHDQFCFSGPGSNAIADFAGDRLVLDNSGFDLGNAGATSTPEPLPAGLFRAGSTGAFTSAEQRFAYDKTNGRLLFDADGNGGGSSPQLVATLGGHPSLTVADLFFVK